MEKGHTTYSEGSWTLATWYGTEGTQTGELEGGMGPRSPDLPEGSSWG